MYSYELKRSWVIAKILNIAKFHGMEIFSKFHCTEGAFVYKLPWILHCFICKLLILTYNCRTLDDKNSLPCSWALLNCYVAFSMCYKWSFWRRINYVSPAFRLTAASPLEIIKTTSRIELGSKSAISKGFPMEIMHRLYFMM